MPKVVATLNQKGGVGKTTLTFHLAHAALGLGKRVLAVDLDTQRNLTLKLLGEIPDDQASEPYAAHRIFTARAGARLRARSTDFGIDLLPGTRDLVVLDGKYTMQHAIARTELVRSLPYDVILFDTPPGLSLRLLAPLLWADVALVPIQPNEFAVMGLNETLEAIQQIQHINPRLNYQLLINLHDRRKPAFNEMVEDLQQIAKFDTVFTDRVAIPSAMKQQVPVWNSRSGDSRLRREWKNYCEALVA